MQWVHKSSLMRVLFTLALLYASSHFLHTQEASISPIGIRPFVLGQPYWIEIKVGDPDTVTNLYGVSFKLTSNRESTIYINESAERGDFLGTAVLDFFITIDGQTVDMAVTRTSPPGVSGSGIIARAQYISTDTGKVEFSLYDVTAIDPNGDAISMTALDLNINVIAIPDPPELNSPPNNTTGVSRNPTLSWNASSGAEHYTVQLSGDEDFSNLIVDEGNVPDTSYTVSDLEYSKTYYWRVMAHNEAGDSPWSVEWSLTIMDEPLEPPAAPELVSPDDGATNVELNPRLIWKASVTAEHYTLQLSTDSQFTDLIVEGENITDTSYVQGDLSENTTYYWRVNASNDAGTSNWSSTWSFTTEDVSSVDHIPTSIPTEFVLHQNYPNPFNPSTLISYGLPERSYVRLSVYDGLGKLVEKIIDGEQESGIYKVTFDASHLPSGVYIYRLQAGEYVESRKLLYLK